MTEYMSFVLLPWKALSGSGQLSIIIIIIIIIVVVVIVFCNIMKDTKQSKWNNTLLSTRHDYNSAWKLQKEYLILS